CESRVCPALQRLPAVAKCEQMPGSGEATLEKHEGVIKDEAFVIKAGPKRQASHRVIRDVAGPHVDRLQNGYRQPDVDLRSREIRIEEMRYLPDEQGLHKRDFAIRQEHLERINPDSGSKRLGQRRGLHDELAHLAQIL